MQPLNRTKAIWDRETRNDININWDIIENNLGSAGSESVEALTKANQALSKSNEAQSKSDMAKETAESVQQQLNDIIISSGTSDAEVIQARGGFDVLNTRLQDKETEFTNGIEENVKKINYLYDKRNLNNPGTQLVGHRGASQFAPENSIPSIKFSKYLGHDAVELDFRVTLDGEIIVMHDETVNRTTNGTGNVADLSLSQIQSLTIDAGPNISQYPNLKVPTMEEAVQYIKELGLILVADLYFGDNPTTLQKFFDILRKYDMETSTICLANIPQTVEIRKISDTVKILFIRYSPINKAEIDIAKEYGIGVSFPASSISNAEAELIRYAHEINVTLNFYTINTPTLFKKLQNLGVQFVSTDQLSSGVRDQGNKFYSSQYTQSITTQFEREYLNFMSTGLKVKKESIPTTNGYYVDGTNNAMYFYSQAGTQGFAIYTSFGKFKKGDIIEISLDVDVLSGEFQVSYSDNDIAYYDPGRQKIYRKIVVPKDDDNLFLAIGTGTVNVGNYVIYDGINIVIHSNRNRKSGVIVSESGNNTIIKEENGVLEILSVVKLTNIQVDTAFGSLFSSAVMDLPAYPTYFSKPPTVSVVPISTGGVNFMWSCTTKPTEFYPPKIIFYRPSAFTIPEIEVHITSKGYMRKSTD